MLLGTSRMRSDARRTVAQGMAGHTVMLGLAIGYGQSPTQPVGVKDGAASAAATVAQLSGAVTGQKSPLADETKQGRNLGIPLGRLLSAVVLSHGPGLDACIRALFGGVQCIASVPTHTVGVPIPR